MIILKLQSSPDFVQYGSFQFEFNQIKLGTPSNSHIVLDSNFCKSFQAMIFESQNGFFIESTVESFHLNGKLAKGTRPLKVGDTLKFFDYIFIVETLSPSINRAFLKEKADLYANVIRDPKADELLAKIESELIKLESEIRDEN